MRFDQIEEEIERLFKPSSSLKGVLKVKHMADSALFLASENSEFGVATTWSSMEGLSPGFCSNISFESPRMLHFLLWLDEMYL